jgi:hypothetical protein
MANWSTAEIIASCVVDNTEKKCIIPSAGCEERVRMHNTLASLKEE